jgi:hypothetical protein
MNHIGLPRHYDPALDHRRHMLQLLDIRVRTSTHRHQVRRLAPFDRPDLLLELQQPVTAGRLGDKTGRGICKFPVK